MRLKSGAAIRAGDPIVLDFGLTLLRVRAFPSVSDCEQDIDPGGVCAPAALGTTTTGELEVARLSFYPLSPDELESRLERSAVPDPCPSPPTVTYDLPPGLFLSSSATCTGKADSTSFYGAGVVNALRAVTAT